MVNESKVFDMEGFLIRLIDVPGFDDTTSDVDTLKRIAAYFACE